MDIVRQHWNVGGPEERPVLDFFDVEGVVQVGHEPAGSFFRDQGGEMRCVVEGACAYGWALVEMSKNLFLFVEATKLSGNARATVTFQLATASLFQALIQGARQNGTDEEVQALCECLAHIS